MTITAHTGAAANGSNTAPKITVPVDAFTGDVFLVHLSLNNTDIITTEPANLHTIGTNIAVSGSAQFTSRLYWGLVDGVNIIPGTVLTWATSATRTWESVLEAYTGVNQATPIHTSAQVQSTNAHVSPAITTTVTSHIVEIASFKPSSSTLITSMAPATGWVVRQSLNSASSFAPAEATAGYDAGNPVPAGTYGSNTWTLNTGTNPEALYSVALLPAASAPNTGSASGAITFTAAAAGKATPKGNGSGTVAFTGSAAGKATPKGNAAGNVTWSAAAAGTYPAKGYGTGTLIWSATAAGARQPKGAAAGTVSWAGTATGTAPVPGMNTGQATGITTWTAAAQGARTPKSGAAHTTAWAGTATGTTQRLGQATHTTTWAGHAVGINHTGIPATYTGRVGKPVWSGRTGKPSWTGRAHPSTWKGGRHANTS